MNNDNIEQLFKYLLRIVNESERRYGDANIKVTKYMISRLKSAKNSIHMMNLACSAPQTTVSTDNIEKLMKIEQLMLDLKNVWEKKLHSWDKDESTYSRYTAKLFYNGSRGRPSLCINIEQVRALREYHFKWDQIARIFSIHRTTLWRKLKQDGYDFQQNYSTVSSQILNEEVTELKKKHPLAGERMIVGFLRAKGLHVQRWKVRDSIHAVDPFNCVARWLQKNPRWIYSVPGPNSLWHNDGLHKLIHWGIIIHACIDGFSRMITSLHCATNNNASTALEGFMKGVKEYGIPARVRGDKGGENIQILQFMRNKQGYQGAYIQGPSVHNQRIERLHYDTTHCVLSQFIDLFSHMEEYDLLDRANNIDLYALQYTYVPRIQNSLNEFKEAWNHHQLSTEKNQSPYQLWLLGMMDDNKSGQRGVRTYLECDADNDDVLFGIDPSPCLGVMPEDLTFVEVRDVSLNQHTEMILRTLQNEFQPMGDDGNFGINVYQEIKNKINNLL